MLVLVTEMLSKLKVVLTEFICTATKISTIYCNLLRRLKCEILDFAWIEQVMKSYKFRC